MNVALPAATGSEPSWRHRPLLAVAAAFLAGVAADWYANPPLAAWLGATAAGLGAAAVALSLGARPGRTAWLVLGACFGLGGAAHHRQFSVFSRQDIGFLAGPDRTLLRLAGRVVQEPTYIRPEHPPYPDPGRTHTVVEVTTVSDGRRRQARGGRVHLTVTGELRGVHLGDAIEATGWLSRIAPAQNPGQRDWRLERRRQRILAHLSVEHPELVRRTGRSADGTLAGLLAPLRREALATLERHLGPGSPASALAAGLLLGSRDQIERGLSAAFMTTGTMHLLAISGQHLSILAGFVCCPPRLADWPSRRRAALLVAAVILVYTVLTGSLAPVVRACVIVLVLCVGVIVGRPTDPANALGLAALVTVWLNPGDLFHTGFQLSFLAVGVIFFAGIPLIHRWLRPIDPLEQLRRRHLPGRRQVALWLEHLLIKAAIVSLITWVGVAPLVANRFHLVSPAAPLLTIVLLPVVAVALCAGFGLMVVGAVSPLAAAPLAWVTKGCLSIIQEVVLFGDKVPGAYFYTAGPPSWWVAAFYALLGLALGGRRVRIRPAALAAAVLLLAIAGLALPRREVAADQVRVHCLAVGHGNATVVEFPDGRTLLYDAGTLGRFDVGQDVVLPFLWDRRIDRLDAVVISHDNIDHMNGLEPVLRAMPVGLLVVSRPFHQSQHLMAKRLLEEARQRGIPIRLAWAGRRLAGLAGVEAVFEHPPLEGAPPDPNDQSLVLAIRYAGRTVLLPGDISTAGQQALLPRLSGPADVLVAPHHGSRKANSAAFVDRTRPAVVVFSAGRGRPPAASCHAYEAVGARTFVTSRCGAVSVAVARDGLATSTFLDPKALGPSRVWVRWTVFLAAVVGVPAGAVLLLAWSGARFLTSPRGRRGSVAPPAGLPAEPLAVTTSDGLVLRGWLVPHPGAQGRTVVFVHGIADSHAALWPLAASLWEGGFNIGLFDLRAHGASDGRRITHGARESRDTADVVAHLRLRREVDPARIGLYGMSMGAVIALECAAADPHLRAVVAQGAYVTLRRVLEHYVWRTQRLRAWPVVGLVLRLVAWRSGHHPDGVNALQAARRIRCPVLLVHGRGDRLVEPAQAEEILANLAGPKALWWVPGADHGDVWEKAGPDLVRRVRAFFDQHL